MGFSREEKQAIIEKFATHPGDVGSSEVQIALLSHRINRLSQHLIEHKLDHHSHRGLLMLVGKRRHLLSYLGREHPERYQRLIQELGLRR
jgi:small subunit ribosomal protein S15